VLVLVYSARCRQTSDESLGDAEDRLLSGRALVRVEQRRSAGAAGDRSFERQPLGVRHVEGRPAAPCDLESG
jgi:hypothetical protein